VGGLLATSLLCAGHVRYYRVGQQQQQQLHYRHLHLLYEEPGVLFETAHKLVL